MNDHMHYLLSLTAVQYEALQKSIQQMCRVFWGPVLEDCADMIDPVFLKPFEGLITASGAEAVDAFNQLNVLCARFTTPKALFDSLEQDYVRLFVSNKQGLIAPLYQSCYEYENAPLMGPSAVAMQKRLESEGLSLADQLSEPPDHLSVELEYLYYLLQKGPEQKDYLKTAGDFAAEEMLPFVNALKDKVAAHGDSLFYFLTLLLLKALLEIISTPHHL